MTLALLSSIRNKCISGNVNLAMQNRKGNTLVEPIMDQNY